MSKSPSAIVPHEVNTQRILTGLNELFEAQLPLAFRLGHGEVTKDLLAIYGNALMIEVAEFVNETPWKQWKLAEPTSLTRVQKEVIAEEFADILAFLGTWIHLLNGMGIPPFALAEAYHTKTKVNHARFSGEHEGYGIK